MGLPMVQVFMIMARQLSRPVADTVMRYGKEHPLFRNRILIPVGRKIVHLTTRLRMKNLGLGEPTTVAPVSEASALEQASDLIQQFVIFCYSVGVFAGYYYYTKANEKEAVTFEHLGQIKNDMETKFFELNQKLDMLEKQLKYALEPKGIFSAILPRSQPPSNLMEKPSSVRRAATLSSLPFEEAAHKITKQEDPSKYDEMP